MKKRTNSSSRAHARDLRRLSNGKDSSPFGFGMTLVFLLFLFFPFSTYAQTSGFFSAAYLQELCKADGAGRETVPGGHTACQAYIAGVIDYHMLMKSLGTAPTIDFCVPNTVSMKRLQAIVWVYLKKHGQHSEFVASPAVTLALYAYYPCKKKR